MAKLCIWPKIYPRLSMFLLMKLCLSIAIIIFQYVKGISNSFVKPRVLLEERKRKRRNQFLSGKCFLRKICDSTKNCDQVHATEVDCETQDKKWFPLLRPLKYQQIRWWIKVNATTSFIRWPPSLPLLRNKQILW